MCSEVRFVEISSPNECDKILKILNEQTEPTDYMANCSTDSTSTCLGFDLDLWPLKVIWGQKNSYHLKAHIWLPIWLLWTTSLYLVPFSRYSISKILGFDLDLWPQKVIWGQKFLYHSKAHIWLPILLLWTPSLYLIYRSRDNAGQNF